MPHTIMYPTSQPTGVLVEPVPAYSPNERPAAGRVPSTEAFPPAFGQEVEVDRLSEETLAYKEMLVVLILILFVLIRSLLV